MLTQGLAREIPAPELHEWLRRALETLRLRAAVIATTQDQAFGLCRELRDDFGMEADAVLADELVASGAPPLPIRRARPARSPPPRTRSAFAQLGSELQKPVSVIEVRPDLAVGEWALLLRQPVYAVVATQEFGEMLREFFKDVPGVENLHIARVRRATISRAIPDDAPTYVTQRVRAQLAGVTHPGTHPPGGAHDLHAVGARDLRVHRAVEHRGADAARRVIQLQPCDGSHSTTTGATAVNAPSSSPPSKRGRRSK